MMQIYVVSFFVQLCALSYEWIFRASHLHIDVMYSSHIYADLAHKQNNKYLVTKRKQ